MVQTYPHPSCYALCMPDHPRYIEQQPCGILAPYVQCYWAVTAPDLVAAGITNRVLPDGCLDILFNLGDPFGRDGVVDVGPSMRVLGVLQCPTLVFHAGHVEVLGVRFRSGGAHPFFRLPLGDLTDRAVPLVELWSDCGAVVDRLADAPSLSGKFRRIERLLLDRLRQPARADAVIVQAVALVRQTQGLASISALARAVGLSPRQLERRFQVGVGVTPKTLCRIVRFRRAHAALRRQPGMAWSELAYRAGFYDQAHLIREFKEFTGLAPGAYARECADVASVQYAKGEPD